MQVLVKSASYLLLCVVGLLAACSSEAKKTLHPIPAKLQHSTLVLDSRSQSKGETSSPGHPKQSISPVSSPAVPSKTIYQLLQGKWQSAEDAQYVLELKGHCYLDYYAGNLNDSTEFILDQACVSAPNAGHPGDNERYLVQPKEDLCLEIVGVDEESLELLYISRGNTLSFTKIN